MTVAETPLLSGSSDGAPAEARAALAESLNRRLLWGGLLANGIGGLIVAIFAGFLVIDQIASDDVEGMLLRSIPVFALYMAITLPLGRWWGAVLPYRPIAGWLRSGRPATDADRERALSYPKIWTHRSAVFWAGAAVLFPLINIGLGAKLAVSMAAVILLGALTACALQYLMVERAIRPIVAVALAGGPPPARSRVPGVAGRLTMAWALATGVALVGILDLAAADLMGVELSTRRAMAAILFLSVVALSAGLWAMVMATRSVAEPLADMQRALEAVERGELDARVEVYDGSEVGRLQAGFNRMAEGLAERERIREAFGTYLDREIAEHILREGTSLAGEQVEVTLMFIDVRDFTGYAERASAPEVVAALNRLFELVVPIIHEHSGHVDKFVGDGLLAVFGAPRRVADHADRALAAAVAIERRVADALDDGLEIGIGLSSGTVVAGNVGGAGRLDFSVIGDAVNVAARVEAATRETGDAILVSEQTKRLLSDRAAANLEERPAMPLKGKSEAVALYAPRVPARVGGEGAIASRG